MKSIRAIVYGVGTQGKLMTKFMVQKGVDIVGAIDLNPEIVGKDLGEVAGLGYPLNVKISNDADALLSQQEADIAVAAIFFDMARMYPIFEKCIKNKLNVLTTAEEALYAWTTSPILASKLDNLAKEHGVTITGSGINIFRVNLVAILLGACQKIESITGKVSSNLGPYGKANLDHYHVGKTKDEFYKKMKEQELKFSSFRITSEALIADLGLTITKIEESTEPAIDDEDIMVNGLGRIVPKGDVTGVIRVFKAETEQGISFSGEQIVKVFNKRESAEGCINEWFVKGVPNLHFKWDSIINHISTSASMVNLIPSIINSEPGYITIEKLPKLEFRAFPLQYYLNKHAQN
ncbi:MAG: dihydrodipicolinate reductase [Candidatus Hodarchaeota archaeon]